MSAKRESRDHIAELAATMPMACLCQRTTQAPGPMYRIPIYCEDCHSFTHTAHIRRDNDTTTI